jgi:archaellum biogenesis ATPase FlaH
MNYSSLQKFESYSELQGMYPIDQEDVFLVDGLIESNSLNLLAAPSYTGKTYVAIDLCRAILTGEDFIGKATNQGGIVYFDNEMKPKYFVKRLRKLNFIDDEDNFVYYNNIFPDVSIDQDKKLFFDQIKMFVKDYDTKLIVVDSLNSSSNGLDENSNNDMREFMNFLNQVSEICTVLIIHHTSKYNNPKNLLREDIRGASCIFNVCDNVFVIDKDDEIRTFKCLKARNSEHLPKPIAFTFDNAEDGLRLQSTNAKNNAEKPSKEQVLSLFKDNSNKTQLFKHFRDNGLIFNDSWMVKLLNSIPEIDWKKGPKNSSIYFLIS